MDSDETNPSKPESGDPQTPPSSGAERPVIIRSKDLLQGRREVWIEHGDKMYRLRITSSGKLYLTK